MYEAGESLVVQPNAPHSFFNKSERPCRVLSVSTYHHERMMKDAVHPDGRTDFLPAQLTQADFEKLTKSMEKNQTFLVARPRLAWMHRDAKTGLQDTAPYRCKNNKEKTIMYLVMGITGKVGGATARHLLKQGKQVRALVRNREKAAKWADQGVELVDGDWNDATAIAAALKGVEGAFVMLPAVWAPSPDYREAKGVIANYVEALTKVVPPRVVALSSMGANRTSGVGMITALSLLEQGFRSLPSPVAFVRAGGFFENFLFGLQAAQGGTLPVFYNPTNRKSTMVASDDIGAEVATLLTGPAWSGHRVIELGSMVSADEVAAQLGEVLKLDVKAFAVPRAGWAEAFEQFGVPKGHTGPAEEMFESVNAGWMDLGITGTEHVAGTTSARDVFAAAQNAVKA